MDQVVNRGEVWWADVPGDKVRPVLVLIRQRFTSRLASLFVVCRAYRVAAGC